jgi:hypothetical protein
LIPKYLNRRLLFYLASKTKNQAFGFLSNLGNWPGKHITHHDPNQIEKYLWVPISLATAVVPVAAGVLNWNGKTILTLRLHSSLNVDANTTEAIMKCWVSSIYQQASLTGGIPETHLQELPS